MSIFKQFLEWVKELSNVLINIDERLGFRKFKKYIVFLLIISVIIFIKPIAKSTVKFFFELSDEIYQENLALRDAYNTELLPVLIEFRTETRADRILYYEYHNSEENSVGIPFKFFEFTGLQDTGYGISQLIKDPSKTEAINTGYINTLYDRLNKVGISFSRGEKDTLFNSLHPGVYDLFKVRTQMEQRVFINVPGINQPVGFIVLEWKDPNYYINENEIIETMNEYIPRINALLSTYTPRNN